MRGVCAGGAARGPVYIEARAESGEDSWLRHMFPGGLVPIGTICCPVWYYAVPTVKRNNDDQSTAVEGSSGRPRRI
jgi:hypothetical protein